MTFSEIVGHDRAKRALQSALSRDTVHHAYLLTGPQGVGRSSLGLAFAKGLLCESGGAESCGNCKSCAQFFHESHPNFRRWGNGEKPIKVGEVRELIRWVSLKAMGGGKRAALLHNVQDMGPNAANALLKTLEEPPPATTLLLTATSSDQVLSTVRSRCQQIRLSPLASATVAQTLVTQHGQDPKRAQQLAVLSGGCLGQALSLTDEALAHRLSFFNSIRDQEDMSIAQWLKVTETMGKDKQQTLQFLNFFESLLRDALTWNLAPEKPLINADLSREVQSWAQSRSPQQLFALLDALNEARQSLLVHVSARVVLERIYLQLGA